MRISRWAIVAMLTAGMPCVAADSAAVITERTLSLDAAHQVATAALEQCRKDGLKVTITVLNRAGRTLTVLHDDGASLHTIENSLRKAWTALTFRTPSGDFGKRVAGNPASAGALHLENVTTMEGGLPILAGTEVIGAIGISGAPNSAQDTVCARTGIDRIASRLAAS